MKKVILITGASSGLGLSMAKLLAEQGHQVYGTGRDLRRFKPVSFIPMKMDVTDDNSVNKGIAEIIKTEGRIDVLVNNAGNGIAGPLYAMPVDAAKRQFEVNFFGVVRLSSAVLPGMIETGRGLLINISSLAGLFGLPYQGLYCASKFAIEGYSQSLRMELQNTGVKVTVVNPGDFKTDFTASREKLPFPLPNLQLKKDFAAAVARMENDEETGGFAGDVANLVCRIVARSNPAHNYMVSSSGQAIVPLLKALLPASIFVKLINNHYGIK